MTMHWCEVFMLVPLGLGVGVLLCSAVTKKKPPSKALSRTVAGAVHGRAIAPIGKGLH